MQYMKNYNLNNFILFLVDGGGVYVFIFYFLDVLW